MQLSLDKLYHKMTGFDMAVAGFRNEIANIQKLRSSMHQCLDDNVELRSNFEQMEGKVSETSYKVGNMSLSYARRLGELDEKLKKLDNYVHRPSAFPGMLKDSVDKLESKIVARQRDLN